MSKKFRQNLQDQAKLRIIQWAAANPDWSPESLISVCKMFINHYGLKNRYLPPDFKREEQEVPDNDTLPRVEGTNSGTTQS